jgi:uncharacterized membrane protein YeiH
VLLDRTVFWIATRLTCWSPSSPRSSSLAVRGLKLPQRLFLIPDAIGLALFTIAGTQIALQWHAPWLVASLLGVITGVVGGVLRDVLCNEVPLVFVRGELYASAAWAGPGPGRPAGTGVSPVVAAWAGMGVVLAARLLAMAFRITLPTYSERQ